MTEPLVDLREILHGLHDHGVEYVLFGATAMLFYGFVRNTEDVDVVVADDEANLGRVHEWLVSIDAHLKQRPQRAFGPRERWGMFRGANATVITTYGQTRGPQPASPSRCSSPTTGERSSEPTRRIASSTPGMNDSRAIESWRIVSV